MYGDAARPETLAAAGAARAAAALVLSASGIKGPQEVVRLARELNPGVRVLARSAYLRERADLRAAGADVVFSGEGEVALAMTGLVLRELGATADQIDRERERVRADLFGDDADERRPAATTPAFDRGQRYRTGWGLRTTGPTTGTSRRRLAPVPTALPAVRECPKTTWKRCEIQVNCGM